MKAQSGPLWFATVFAIWKIGYNVIVMDNACTEQYRENIMRHSGAKALITSDYFEANDCMTIDFNGLSACTKVSGEIGIIEYNFANKIALCTSGTTGIPQIYVYTGKQIITDIKIFLEKYGTSSNLDVFFQDDIEKKAMLMFPYHHVSSVILLFSYTFLEATIVISKSSSLSRIISAIRQSKVRIVHAVPLFWESILTLIRGRYGAVTNETVVSLLGQNVYMGVAAAAKAPKEIMVEFNNAGLVFMEGYGSTETGYVTSNVSPIKEERLNGSLGKIASKYYSAKLIKDDGTMTDNGIGELLIKSNGVFYAMLIKGREVLREDPLNGYWNTGDMVQISNGYLYHLGRKKDVIVNSSGENIYPEELRSEFEELSLFNVEYTIVGIDNDPAMVVSLLKQNSGEAMQNSILNTMLACNSRLPIFQRITKVYFTSKGLPLTTNKKYKKDDLIRDIQEFPSQYKKVELKKA